VAAYAPALALHPTDAFNPCSGEWFAARSALRRGGQVVAPVGGTTLALALAEQARLGGPAAARHALALDLDPAARGGVATGDLDADVPLYVRAQLAVPPPGAPPRRPALEITYLALYAHNGPYRLAGLGPAVGAHDGDWERVTARVDAESGELVAVWYNAHRPRDGGWVAAADAPRGSGGGGGGGGGGGRLLAYVARHGHGAYPVAGVVPRAFGLANDRTSDAGPLWRPRRAVMLRVGDSGGGPGGAPAPTLGRVACRGCEVDDGRRRGVPPPSTPPPVAVVDDTEGVGDYAGAWGTVLAPREQGWWARSECPASRGTGLRLFCQAWPEPE
jgi:hypothetical protein